MQPNSPGLICAQEIYVEYFKILLQASIVKQPICLIEEQEFNASIFAAMPDLTQSITDKLIDLAFIDTVRCGTELQSAGQAYRFFRVVDRGTSRFAVINPEIVYVQAFLMHPLDHELLNVVYGMGRCTALDDRGKRCKRRAAVDRLCRGHAPQNQPAPPPAAE